MSKQKKITLIAVCVLLIGIAGFAVVQSLVRNGYAYYGDGWQDTPEKALAQAAAGGTLEDEQTLTVQTRLDTLYIDDTAQMLFVSEGNTLVLASFVQNEDGKWHYEGHSRESSLENPNTFVLNGDSRQFILAPYAADRAGTTVYGWKLSDTPPLLVEGKPVEVKTYRFSMDGKDWAIDYWWIQDDAFRDMGTVALSFGGD